MITESFPPEITREILLKASVKSLLQCKSVCKEWYSLISDHHFIKSHFTLSSTNNINYKHHRLIYNSYDLRNDLYSCPFYDVLFDKSVNNVNDLYNLYQLENPLQRTRSERLRIIGSCNGLLCVLGIDYHTLFIYNPSTRTTNILPPSKLGVGASSFSYGFGYDDTTHDYKVVKIWRRGLTMCDLGAMIYSLKAESWKEIGRFPPVNPFDDGKFVNGALHWVTGDVCSGSGDIVSLDLGREAYGEVLQPEYDGKGHKTLTLGVLGESLFVLCNYYESRVLDVWVMKVYGMKDSWTKLLSISHPNDRNSISSPIKYAPLYISNDGKLLLVIGLKLVVYDCINGSYSVIQNFLGFRDTCIVVESLISPFAPFGLGDNNGNEN